MTFSHLVVRSFDFSIRVKADWNFLQKLTGDSESQDLTFYLLAAFQIFQSYRFYIIIQDFQKLYAYNESRNVFPIFFPLCFSEVFFYSANQVHSCIVSDFLPKILKIPWNWNSYRTCRNINSKIFTFSQLRAHTVRNHL